MWKRIVLAVLALLLIVYSVMWFLHAGKTEDQAKAFFATLSQQHGIEASYDDLSVGGYPFEFSTRFKNLSFSVDMVTLMERVRALNPQGAATAALPPAGSVKETVRFPGDVTLNVNYFTRSFGFEVGEVTEGESRLEENVLRWKDTRTGLSRCLVTLSPQADMSIFQESALSVLSRPEVIVQNFRKVDCALAPSNIINVDTQESLFKSGTQTFVASFDQPSKHAIAVDVHLDSNDLEASAAWSENVNRLMHYLQPEEENAMSFMGGTPAAGKQNAELKLSYRGPADMQQLPLSQEIVLDVPTFSLSNDLYTLTLPMSLKINKVNSQYTGNVSILANAKFEPAFDTYIEENTPEFAAALMPPSHAHNSPEVKDTERKEIEDSVRAMIPAFGSFKNTNFTLEAAFKGNRNIRVPQMEGELNLSNLALMVGDYGLSGTGNVFLSPQRGEVSLRCHKCHETVEKILIFISDTQKLAVMMDPAASQIPEGLAFRNAVADFVESISTPAEDTAEDRIITISSSGNGQVVISGRSSNEVGMQAMQVLMPHFLAPAMRQQQPMPQPQ